MRSDIHNRKQRLEARRRCVIESATVIIKAVAEQRIDSFVGWQQVCGIFQSNAGLGLPELKEVVQIAGVNPNSSLSATEELRDTIKRKAVEFLSGRSLP